MLMFAGGRLLDVQSEVDSAVPLAQGDGRDMMQQSSTVNVIAGAFVQRFIRRPQSLAGVAMPSGGNHRAVSNTPLTQFITLLYI